MSLNRNLLNKCFFELAKLYKKAIRNQPHYTFEIIIVGGGAVVANYNFRLMTNDVDAEGTLFSQCIKEVAKKLKLNDEWLNNDFIKTESYSRKITQYSKFYKNFLDVLDVRIISREYLIAMKLKSFREYKNDLSDIVGILIEESKTKPVKLQEIKTAVENLYGSYEKSLNKEAKDFIETAIIKKPDDLDKYYQDISEIEKYRHDKLIQIDKQRKGTINEKNVNDIVKRIDEHKSASDILKEIDKAKSEKIKNAPKIDDDFEL